MGTPRKSSAISAAASMPEDFSYGQKDISRLPAVSPLIYSTTEAKLPNQTPGKTFVLSASAAMPKDLPLWAERNRKIDALRSRSDRQTSSYSSSLRTVMRWWCRDSRLSPKARRLDPHLPHRPTGAITDSAPKVRRVPHPSNPKVRHNRSLVV